MRFMQLLKYLASRLRTRLPSLRVPTAVGACARRVTSFAWSTAQTDIRSISYPFHHSTVFFFFTIRRPPTSTLFPYTTLFRSSDRRRFPAPMHTWWTTRHRSPRSEEHTSELQSRENLVCRLLLEKKKNPGARSSMTAWRCECVCDSCNCLNTLLHAYALVSRPYAYRPPSALVLVA